MGHYSIKTLVRGVSRDKLFQWYTDYSPEDVEIIKRRGNGSLASRKVTKEGDKILVESEVLFRGKPRKLYFDITAINPETYTYDVKLTSPGFESHRHYTFTEVPGEGTMMRFDEDYRVTGTAYKILDALGILKLGAKYSAKHGGHYVYAAEAEEQLGDRRKP